MSEPATATPLRPAIQSSPTTPALEQARSRYLELMKRCLTRSMFDESFDRIPMNRATLLKRLRSAGYRLANRLFSPWNLVLVHSARPTGETMIGMERLDNLQVCITDVVRNDIPGDLIETGVWRGGATIFMKAVLEAYNDSERRVWVADSFRGLPKPNPEKYPADEGDVFWQQSLAIPVEEVRRNFERYGLLDERVEFLVGFFSETMPKAPIERLAVLRLDGDMYESTIDVLEHLYPKLSVGGYCIVDD